MQPRVVVVTGGASGIGAATARAFAAQGDAVVVADLDGAAGEAVVDAIVADGGAARSLVADVASVDGAAAVVAAALDAFGGLHVACNVAGASSTPSPVADISLEAWDATMRANVTSTLLCMQAELPAIAESGGGAIVNMASAAGLIGVSHMAAYSASKHAVVGLTRSAALEWARAGIRINVLCPGTVDTPMLRAHLGDDPDALAAAGRHGSPMARLGTPEEIAAAALWLCSEGAGYVTGHAMAVDGGAGAT